MEIFVPLSANVPLAPLAGAEKVTCALLTGLPMLSSTNTFSGVLKAQSGGVFCGVPSKATMLAAGPGGVYSYAPMSQRPTRATPRWSVFSGLPRLSAQPAGLPALIAGLPGNKG